MWMGENIYLIVNSHPPRVVYMDNEGWTCSLKADFAKQARDSAPAVLFDEIQYKLITQEFADDLLGFDRFADPTDEVELTFD